MSFVLAWFMGCAAPPESVPGHFLPCPERDPCVSSEADINDGVHFLEPIRAPAGHTLPNDTLARLRSIILSLPGGAIAGGSATTLRATFTSSFLGFVDDLELRMDPKLRAVQVRSASRWPLRSGQGVRDRVEAVRTAWNARFGPAPEP